MTIKVQQHYITHKLSMLFRKGYKYAYTQDPTYLKHLSDDVTSGLSSIDNIETQIKLC